jgi:hypothetical protein
MKWQVPKLKARKEKTISPVVKVKAKVSVKIGGEKSKKEIK